MTFSFKECDLNEIIFFRPNYLNYKKVTFLIWGTFVP